MTRIVWSLILAVGLLAIAVGSYVGIAALYDMIHASPPNEILASPAPSAPAEAGQVVRVPPDTAKALPALCMSDAELNAYAKYAAFQPIAFGAGKCGERFPDLTAEARADVDALSKAHGAALTALADGALPPFVRSFGPEAVKKRDARLDADQKPTFQRILGYSRAECKSHLAAIEGFGHMSEADFDNVLNNLVRQILDTQRAAMPPCG